MTLDGEHASLLQLRPCQLRPVQDVAVALAVAVVDVQLLHRLQLGAELDVCARLENKTKLFLKAAF
jgi:ABC-type antimicrobial peptide transport system permease subunit